MLPTCQVVAVVQWRTMQFTCAYVPQHAEHWKWGQAFNCQIGCNCCRCKANSSSTLSPWNLNDAEILWKTLHCGEKKLVFTFKIAYCSLHMWMYMYPSTIFIKRSPDRTYCSTNSKRKKYGRIRAFSPFVGWYIT